MELTIWCERLESCISQESCRNLPKVGMLQTPYSYIGAELCAINYQNRSATVVYKSDHGLVKEVVPLSLVRINALDKQSMQGVAIHASEQLYVDESFFEPQKGGEEKYMEDLQRFTQQFFKSFTGVLSKSSEYAQSYFSDCVCEPHQANAELLAALNDEIQ